MVNISSQSYNMHIPANVMEASASVMTQNSFALSFGKFGSGFLSIALTFFALTTIVGWYFFAESNVKFLSGKNKVLIASFKFIVLAFIVLSTYLDPNFVWKLADLFMGLMAIPNIIALFLLSGIAKKVLEDYDTGKKAGHVLWKYRYD